MKERVNITPEVLKEALMNAPKDKLAEIFKGLSEVGESMKDVTDFLNNGGVIFPKDNIPRLYKELNKFEKEEVVSDLGMYTAPISGVFEGETPEEIYGDLLDIYSISRCLRVSFDEAVEILKMPSDVED